MRRIPMHMKDWISKLDGFLNLNERDILTHAGAISHEVAKELAETEYDKFHQTRIEQQSISDRDFEEAVKELPRPIKKVE